MGGLHPCFKKLPRADLVPTNEINKYFPKDEKNHMNLTEITIENFCSCLSVTVPISSFTPLIGYNNAGKSNILRAVVWLLKKSVLPQCKFNDPAKPVVVTGLISAVRLDVLPSNQQAQLQKFLQNDSLRFRRKQDTPGAKATEIKLEVFDPTTGDWQANSTGTDNAIGALFPEPIFVEAMDDASVDIAQYAAKNTIGLLLKNTMEQIKINNLIAHTALTTSLTSAASHLSGPQRIAEFSNFEKDATKSLNEFFPGLSVHLAMQSPTIDDVIKTASISLSESQGGPRGFTSFGHGTQRSVQMALINLLAKQLKPAVSGQTTTLLLIDEPELYLHPHAIELLCESLQKISENGFQVIVTTHSPLLIGNRVLDSIIAYKDTSGNTDVRQKLADAATTLNNQPHQASVVFSLENASYLLFSENVLIVEGKTEKMLVPELYQFVRNSSLAREKTCLIEVCGSTSIAPTIRVLKAVGFKSKAIVDLDYLFRLAPIDQPNLLANLHYVECKTWFQVNHSILGFMLETDGFPKKGNGWSAADAFEKMATAMPQNVKALAQHLLASDLWVWSRGAIEAHLGIAKTDKDRLLFIKSIESSKSISHASDAQSLIDCMNWI